jgi:transposase
MENDTHQDSHEDGDRYRRVEVITGTRRRRNWTIEERSRILAESFVPGANVSAIARRHGVNGGLLHYWRKCAKASVEQTSSPRDPAFVPLSMAKSCRDELPRSVPSAHFAKLSPTIEIEIAGAIVRVSSAVDQDTLVTVLTALRRAS